MYSQFGACLQTQEGGCMLATPVFAEICHCTCTGNKHLYFIKVLVDGLLVIRNTALPKQQEPTTERLGGEKGEGVTN